MNQRLITTQPKDFSERIAKSIIAHLFGEVKGFDERKFFVMNFEFDLESAERELECVSNLLCIYQEFFDDEAPQEETCNDTALAALVFARRVRQFHSLIDTVHDKIFAMHKEVATAIEKQYNADDKKGGEVA